MNNDLIRRSDALKAIANDGDEHWWYEERINEVPAVDAVEVVHAKWEFVGQIFCDGGYEDIYTCSKCHEEFDFAIGKELTNYCPNCGARMDGE